MLHWYDVFNFSLSLSVGLCGCVYLDSGYLVSVARLLVYICPPTSIWTGALVLLS